jgi:hypothetical protein
VQLAQRCSVLVVGRARRAAVHQEQLRRPDQRNLNHTHRCIRASGRPHAFQRQHVKRASMHTSRGSTPCCENSRFARELPRASSAMTVAACGTTATFRTPPPRGPRGRTGGVPWFVWYGQCPLAACESDARACCAGSSPCTAREPADSPACCASQRTEARPGGRTRLLAAAHRSSRRLRCTPCRPPASLEERSRQERGSTSRRDCDPGRGQRGQRAAVAVPRSLVYGSSEIK